ncbi:metallophosphoesterase family protein [Paenibacillus sp. NPDC058071]|uniref:metallophosphoesterase family protein n=1 Tax=Paenibacillus sp. NPDC058071 TaxID=3346326 RepID=UPI0036D7E60E
MEPILFAHLTDTHINVTGKNPLFQMDMTKKLRELFAELGKLSRKPDFVVISGDLTQDGDTEDYRHLRSVLDEEKSKLGVPVYVALGNHDTRSYFREGYLQEEPTEESYYYSVTEKGLRLVVLNTQVPGQHGGRLDEEQLEWLRKELATPATGGTIIVHHHPVVPTITPLMDSHLLDNPQDLAAAIEGTDVIGLLSGHIHCNNISLFHGVPSAAATGVAFGIEPTSNDSMKFVDNSGYNLVLVKEGQMIVHPMAMAGSQQVVFEWKMDAAQAHS